SAFPNSAANGTLLLNGNPVTAPISVADIDAGLLVFTAPATVPASDHSISFKVQDNGGTSLGGVDTSLVPNTITLHITTGPGQAPSGNNLTRTTSEDVPY